MEDGNGIDLVGSFRALVFIADGNEKWIANTSIIFRILECNYLVSNDRDALPHFGLT